MKKAFIMIACLTAMMVGSTVLKAQEVSITLIPGWTWISCPTTEAVGFDVALGDFTPMQGDVIKSQWGSAIYRNGQWKGNISQFNPGYGYHYKSNRTVPVVVTFNAQQPTSQVVVTTSEPTDITTTSATCGGNVASSDGNYVFVILRGICWNTSPNPTFNDNYIEAGNGLGSFTVSLTELPPNTTFYVRAFAVTPAGTFYGDEVSVYTQIWSNGILPGAFSVSENQQVYFSQGNLQYKASMDTWRFAENQWDYVGTQTTAYGNIGGTVSGSDNCNISQTYDGWIDLFGWGTSGYDHGAVCYYPWSIGTPYVHSEFQAYGQWTYNLNEQSGQADWGYNPISNGGNYGNSGWRTLTSDELGYVLFMRYTSSGIRFAKGQVNGVNGIILLPDNWSTSTYTISHSNDSRASFSTNIISLSEWNTLENAGAVFLPAAGERDGTTVYSGGNYGNYWSSTHFDYSHACILYFYDSDLSPYINYEGDLQYLYIGERWEGGSVRLVRDVQ